MSGWFLGSAKKNGEKTVMREWQQEKKVWVEHLNAGAISYSSSDKV